MSIADPFEIYRFIYFIYIYIEKKYFIIYVFILYIYSQIYFYIFILYLVI